MNLNLSPYAKNTEPGKTLTPKRRESNMEEWRKLNKQLQDV
jgi:hypothetical protein